MSSEAANESLEWLEDLHWIEDDDAVDSLLGVLTLADGRTDTTSGESAF
jgi:hypothetical protein